MKLRKVNKDVLYCDETFAIYLLKNKGEHRTPLLLLDDIFDKLDAHRVERIIDYVSSQDFEQIFITDTRRDHLDKILASTQQDYKLFSVVEGRSLIYKGIYACMIAKINSGSVMFAYVYLPIGVFAFMFQM